MKLTYDLEALVLAPATTNSTHQIEHEPMHQCMSCIERHRSKGSPLQHLDCSLRIGRRYRAQTPLLSPPLVDVESSGPRCSDWPGTAQTGRFRLDSSAQNGGKNPLPIPEACCLCKPMLVRMLRRVIPEKLETMLTFH
jgi:hypothetical protein